MQLASSLGTSHPRRAACLLVKQLASSSGIVHSLCFFIIGIRLWKLGSKNGYMTQIQYFRGRYQSNAIGYLLFPILVALVVPYLLIGLLGAGAVVRGFTAWNVLDAFASRHSPASSTGSAIGGLLIGCIERQT